MTLEEAARDALSGWRYIRMRHGDLDGVAWDRVENALAAALSAPRQGEPWGWAVYVPRLPFHCTYATKEQAEEVLATFPNRGPEIIPLYAGAPPTNKEDDAPDAPMVAAMRPEIAEELIRDGIPPGEIILSAPPAEASREELHELRKLLNHVDGELSAMAHGRPMTDRDEMLRLSALARKHAAQLERGDTT